MTRARWGFFLGITLACVVAVVAAWVVLARPILLPRPHEFVANASRPAFVGAEACKDCHAAQFAAWEQSTHGRAGGAPSPKTVIAPFYSSVISSVIRFADAVVIPRVRGDTYEFVVRQAGEPEQVLGVAGVIGGGHIYGGGTQGFVAQAADGTVRFLPFEWSKQQRAWFCNTNSRSGKGWTPIVPTMRIEECGDWPPVRVLGDIPRFANCQSCHASQATVTLDSASHRYATTYTSLAINCESCHGPGGRHVDLARRGTLTTADIGLTALGTLDKDASIGVCYQCHALKDQLRPGFVSGDRLADYYSLHFPQLGDRPLYPDGRTRTFAYQEGHSFSDCYLNGGMTCVSCHDPHTQQYRDVNGVTLQGRFDDRQCTTCHASKAENPSAHTKHQSPISNPRSEVGNRKPVGCVSCHMPFRQQRDTRPAVARFASTATVPYARSDHTISIPRPALDSALGLASACSSCHATMSIADQEAAIGRWWGELKPLPATVAAQYRVSRELDAGSAAPLLLGAAADSSHAYARFAGVSLFLDAYVVPNAALPESARARVNALAGSGDPDARAIALAIMHLADGDGRSTRRTLARVLSRETRDAPLRDRWSLALAYMGDRYASQGNTGNAEQAFRRALEVNPGSARLELSLANTLRDAGLLDSALAAYRRSVALDGAVPLAWVNYGIALGAAGDTVSAIRALTQAARLDEREPLAWFNLANLYFVRGDLDRAAAMYQRAASADPALALAQFQLARIALIRKDEPRALAALRRGLAFDSSDASAVEMHRVLAKRLKTGATERP